MGITNPTRPVKLYWGSKFGKSNVIVYMMYVNFSKGFKLPHKPLNKQKNMVKVLVLENTQCFQRLVLDQYILNFHWQWYKMTHMNKSIKEMTQYGVRTYYHINSLR